MLNKLMPRTWRAVATGLGLCLSFAASVASAIPSDSEAQALLARSDAVRNPPGSFSVQLTLTEFRKGVQANRSGLVIYSKPSPRSGQYSTLVRFMAPARDANKLMLRSGADLWFFDPATRASVRISPQQRLLGQASNGDVMSAQLARDYTAHWVGEERIKDGEGKDCACVHLHLRASGEFAPYAVVEYWVNPDSQSPVMARFMTHEGRLLKTAYFRKFMPILGAQRPTETVIIDGLDPDWVTLMQSTQLTAREVPETWLQRDYLSRFTGE